MFPSGVDLKLKRHKGSIFGKERQNLCHADTGVCVVSVCVLMLASGCGPGVQC